MAKADAKKRRPDDDEQWETIEAGAIIPWEQGLHVRGYFVALKATPGMYGKENALLKVRVGSLVETYGAPAMLRSKLESVATGEEINVTCLGKTKNKGGNQQWDFNVQRRKVRAGGGEA